MTDPAQQAERDYHERLYSGFAQSHFARPAVRALRAHMARRILACTGAGPRSRVLSIGCGIGDTELLLAPHVGEILGTDLSPAAVRQANHDAAARGIGNFRAVEAAFPGVPAGPYDTVIAIFFLHHLPGPLLDRFPERLKSVLAPGGVFYSLDPSRSRLSGWIGERLFPKLMARYQSPGENPLDRDETAGRFRAAGLEVRAHWYGFVSTPLAGLFPGGATIYSLARTIDQGMIRLPGWNRWSSNFELVVRREY